QQDLEQTIRDQLSPKSDGDDNGPSSEDEEPGGNERVYDIGRRFRPEKLAAPTPGRVVQPRSGRRTKLRERGSRGHYVSSEPIREEPSDLAIDATLRASARRFAESAGTRRITAGDLHRKVRETKIANLILFAVDASGSMAAMDRMAAAKGAILSLLLDAYQKRDQVGLIAFRGKTGELLLPPTNSVDLAERQLRQMATGGRTPLSHALQLGLYTIERHRSLHRDAVPLFVLISDGRPNVSLGGGDPVRETRTLAGQFADKHINAVIIDTEASGLRLGLARALADDMGAGYFRLEELDATRVAGAVRHALGRPN
ncbi:MAG: VWA domain-containing protein, partial [Chloroflexi bacterium]|nr:VWA domain-containing protein [Chloroflexota bacterium]